MCITRRKVLQKLPWAAYLEVERVVPELNRSSFNSQNPKGSMYLIIIHLGLRVPPLQGLQGSTISS